MSILFFKSYLWKNTKVCHITMYKLNILITSVSHNLNVKKIGVKRRLLTRLWEKID